MISNLIGILCLFTLLLVGAWRYRLRLWQTIYLLFIIILIPAWWHSSLSISALTDLVALIVVWFLYIIITNKKIKILLLVIVALLSGYLTLRNTQILTPTGLDFERTFWIDNQNNAVLDKFVNESLFLPYQLRGHLWGQWWQGSDVIFRSFTGLGGDQLWPVIGVALWSFTFLSLFYKAGFGVIFIIWLTIALGWLGRNPNIGIIGIYLLPSMLVLSIKTIKLIPLKVLICLILVTIPFLF